ncbi:MAG: MFS transporter, partial [Myxococcales bacterium]|nr:MFS transporter [Myxococcales bacterium]
MSPYASLSTAQKFSLLGALYFSQGLPFGFFTQALPVILRERGFSLAEIGLSSMLALPWALKFLWAPAVDRYALPGLERRKSWILPLQLAVALTLVFLSLVDALSHLRLLLVAVFLINLLAATQDIATDALAVEALRPTERGLANGLQVAGYRVGMIVGGGLLLILFDALGPLRTFLAMAALTILATAPLLRTRTAAAASAEAREPGIARPREAAASPPHFLRRPGAMGILLLLTSYKFGDAFATSMLRPFLVDAGLGL